MTGPAAGPAPWTDRNFEEFEKRLNGGSGSALHALRRIALDRFRAKGFPTTREEEWRFTGVRPIAETDFALAPPAVPADLRAGSLPFAGAGGPRLVFVDGRFSPGLSDRGGLPAGVKVGSLTEALREEPEALAARFGDPSRDDAFTLLNTAFLGEGAVVRIPEAAVVPAPIHLVWLATSDARAFACHPRNLILAGKGCRATIVETYASHGKGVYFTNSVTEILAGEGAAVEHDRFQDESDRAYHVGSLFVRLDAGSTFTSTSVSLGAAMARINTSVVFGAPGAECTLNGLSLATGSQHVDNHTAIDHALPRCNSHELYKSILDGRAKGVFNGKIIVRPGAQKTDAKQTNKTLLLSDDATMNTKPQLEIFADDVRCTHGATVGQLDRDQLFYLRARGIAEADARDILTSAFAGDVVGRIAVAAVRDEMDALIRRRLRKGRDGAA